MKQKRCSFIGSSSRETQVVFFFGIGGTSIKHYRPKRVNNVGTRTQSTKEITEENKSGWLEHSEEDLVADKILEFMGDNK
jgi:hypothetical protein